MPLSKASRIIRDRKWRERLKILRPYIEFNYNLNEPLSSGAKAAITRAWDEFQPYRNQRAIRIRKRKGETKTQLKRRKNDVAETLGQSGRFKAVFADVSKDAKIRITDDGIKASVENFTERFVPADTFLVIEDPEAEADRIWKTYRFDWIGFDHSGFRSGGMIERSFQEEFVSQLRRMGTQYRSVIEHAVSGYILRTDRKKPKKQRRTRGGSQIDKALNRSNRRRN